MEKLVGKTDFEFFWRISSLYNALSYTAIDPIVFHEGNSSSGLNSDAYYDNELAIPLIKKRIKIGADDIIKNYEIHKDFLKYFSEIDLAIKNKDRINVGNNVELLCNLTSDYLNFVKKHKSQLPSKYFLDYPTCKPEHYFQLRFEEKGDLMTHHLRFNTKINRINGEKDLNKIRKIIPLFGLVHGDLYRIEIMNQIDPDKGVTNPLKNNIERNKELLKRIGFDVFQHQKN